jgi:replicative DNA helicase
MATLEFHITCNYLTTQHDQTQLMRGLHAHAGTKSGGLETMHERHQVESVCRLASPPSIESANLSDRISVSATARATVRRLV